MRKQILPKDYIADIIHSFALSTTSKNRSFRIFFYKFEIDEQFHLLILFF